MTSNCLPANLIFESRAMMFVDGENLAIRYKKLLGNDEPKPHVTYEPDIFVWSGFLNMLHQVDCEVIRRHYYTCTPKDEKYRREIEDKLKKVGIQAPRVFSKVRGTKSKRVDITLATEMLTHAHRKNYDIAILVAGDEDYVPLVRAVMGEGCRVFLWFFEDGLSDHLRKEADHFFNVGSFLFEDAEKLHPR